MRFSIATAAAAFAWLTAALPTVEPEPAVQANYDVIVVGGGPSGLSAASALARVRRNVLLIDSGEYRNQYTRRIHDVLGFDGVTPAYFRWRARQQILEYPTVHLTNGTVSKIEANGDAEYTSFSVTANFSANGNTVVTARKVILATGLRDIVPTTPGLAENWGKGIYWCPWCDGYEHADQSFGVLGPLDKSGNTPLEVLTLNKDIIIFANGTDTPENREIVEGKLPGFETWHALHNITVDNRTIVSLERLKDAGALNEDPSKATLPEHDLFRVNFEGGESVERAAFVTNWLNEQRSKIGEEAGVALYGGKLAANLSAGMITNVPGIYAVGDANSDNSTNVPHAMWSGKRAVVSLHVTLEKENAEFQIAQAGSAEKRDLVERERMLWARVNDGDLLNAGSFDRF
ncbi:Putative FAD/NAD(P)-binding domain, FAD/NAD(P)-binding domain superfamily [Septoria linicola]|uniref:FAD/NAD(P)-binding domain, FAD/NAD(P)-binding domain superfamily n=1 Tax=Septoria linicola TaxID=215465 RepID=A0A9Q9EF66_9PEZI|nr:putative FAD/NAD(P)-binding domain, FAD/NAD(P)-binding domain superfamily [Septoria linicola]USW47639.1 Putative FAD/NAD(P)-binding domain, FAD/NAD(P)-binding domain superfamily [Septoria linicola]